MNLSSRRTNLESPAETTCEYFRFDSEVLGGCGRPWGLGAPHIILRPKSLPQAPSTSWSNLKYSQVVSAELSSLVPFNRKCPSLDVWWIEEESVLGELYHDMAVWMWANYETSLHFGFLLYGMKIITATYMVIKGLRGIIHTKRSQWAPVRRVASAYGVLATSWALFWVLHMCLCTYFYYPHFEEEEIEVRESEVTETA